MANHENLSTQFIYLRSTGEKISVPKEQRDAFYKEADRIRHKEQLHHRCMCSKNISGNAMETASDANIMQSEIHFHSTFLPKTAKPICTTAFLIHHHQWKM